MITEGYQGEWNRTAVSAAARLLTEHPDCKPWIKRIVLMAGSVRIGYKGKPPAAAKDKKTRSGARPAKRARKGRA